MSATAAATATVAGVDVPTDHYINGERVGSDRTFTTISPIDESVLAEVARAGEREADLAVRAAHDAFPGGRRWGRRDALRTCTGWPT
jgi:acyl-CoA reductase-like NAD-dependent aldehyde dehydrogenase